jgi:hypothetical protein
LNPVKNAATTLARTDILSQYLMAALTPQQRNAALTVIKKKAVAMKR